MADLIELMAQRNVLKGEIRLRSLYPWRYDNLLGHVDSPEGLHPSWNMTFGQWLEQESTLLAESIDRRFKLYGPYGTTCNCFYVVTPTGEVHGYYGYSARASFERHVRGIPSGTEW